MRILFRASLALGLSVILALPAFSWGPTVKIGAIETLTGDNAAYGLSIRKGLELGVEQLNTSGVLGKSRLQLVVMDDKGDKQEGISVMNKLIHDEKVCAILGPTLSSTAFAADPIAQAAGVPVLGTSNTAKGITDMGNFVFRDSLPESGVIPGALQKIQDKYHPKKAVILYEQTNELTKSELEIFRAALKAEGTQVVAVESYSKGDTDFRTQLNKLRLHRPDLLVLCSLIGEGVPILEQAREVGFRIPIIGGNGFNSPNLVKQAKEAAEGLIVGSAWFLGSKVPESQKFAAAFRQRYGQDPDLFAAQAYMGVHLLAAAIKKAGSDDPKAVRGALAAIRSYRGVLGSFSFDADRNPVHDGVTLIVKDGQYTVFE